LQSPPSPLATWAAFSVLRILIAPLFAFVSLVGATLAPYRVPRIAFLVAAAMEAAVTGYGALVWIVPMIVERT
jgi:nitrate reductase NapE component